MSEWFYRKETLLGDDDIGPMSRFQIESLILKGDIKPETLVRNGQAWTSAAKALPDSFSRAADVRAANAVEAERYAQELKKKRELERDSVKAQRAREKGEKRLAKIEKKRQGRVPASEDGASEVALLRSELRLIRSYLHAITIASAISAVLLFFILAGPIAFGIYVRHAMSQALDSIESSFDELGKEDSASPSRQAGE